MTAPARLRRTLAGALRAMLDAAAECRAHGLDDDAEAWLRHHDALAGSAINAALRTPQTRRLQRVRFEIIDGGA
jgi:hypothetical protein